MTLTDFAPAIAATTAALAACLAAYFAFLNADIQKKIKVRDLTRLLHAEITNLARHCRVAAREIARYSTADAPGIATAKYNDGKLMLFDPKEAYILNENLCQDVMQLSLLSRNNDIYIEYLVMKMNSSSISNEEFEKQIARLAMRMGSTAKLCAAVLSHLETFARDPRGYREPAIDW
jgi:hypothetical protein